MFSAAGSEPQATPCKRRDRTLRVSRLRTSRRPEVSMRKHMDKNRKDKDSKFRLVLVESAHRNPSHV